ncbi:MAG: hypothetical protein RMI34_03330 [Chloroherpetonaceae bacterium]|nr:hypothetical protein [Chloroherpetonaceae bacterium]MCS7211593.1 hypothetical protein [Chloroherpetonaceae bacterium]MDW8019091.1 hypothetical protein [Chloroherpetonaceae bacterium]
MEKEIVIVSVTAGGGHKSAMHSLGESLKRYAPDVRVVYFESTVEDIEKAHRVIYSKFTRLYDRFYDLMEQDAVRGAYFCFTRSIIEQLKAELRPFFERAQTGLIVSTHFMQTYALLQLKASLQADTHIAAYVPDFDESLIHVPRYRGLLPNSVIAQSPAYLAKLQEKYGLLASQTLQAGYIPRSPFTAARSLSQMEARVAFQRQNLPMVSNVLPECFTVVATGGTYWVEHLYKQFEVLATDDEFDWHNSQVLVVCGNNARAYKKFSDLAERSGKRIIPLPFLNAEQMSLAFRSASVTVLSGIAPATLYELLETDAGPILIHRINPGPEKFNLAVATSRHLADYCPDPAALLQRLIQLSQQPQAADAAKQAFCQHARVEREAALLRAKAVALSLAQMLQQSSVLHASAF